MPFATNTFDVVMSRLVIHHLPGDLKQRGFAEMYRVLKPGGQFIVVDFALPKWLHPISKMHGMFRINVQTYVKLLEDAGFSDLEVAHTGYPLLAYVRGRKTKS
jgi:ubiquinone/menaquinone biosynthesis C-methylase UbiE